MGGICKFQGCLFDRTWGGGEEYGIPAFCWQVCIPLPPAHSSLPTSIPPFFLEAGFLWCFALPPLSVSIFRPCPTTSPRRTVLFCHSEWGLDKGRVMRSISKIMLVTMEPVFSPTDPRPDYGPTTRSICIFFGVNFGVHFFRDKGCILFSSSPHSANCRLVRADPVGFESAGNWSCPPSMHPINPQALYGWPRSDRDSCRETHAQTDPSPRAPHRRETQPCPLLKHSTHS